MGWRWIEHRRCVRQMVLHFQRQLPGGEERAMRRHLQRCGECRSLYSALTLSEGQGAEAERARHERLESAIFGAAPVSGARAETSSVQRRRLIPTLAWPALAATAAVALLIIWPRHASEPRVKGPVATASQLVSISAYARTPGGALRPARGTIPRGRPLAFSYLDSSREGYDRLLLLGVDERYNVYWFYPAWTDPKTNPTAYPLPRSRGVAELPDEVGHTYEGSRLRVFALFTKRRDLSVRQIEDQVEQLKRRGTPLQQIESLPVPGTAQHSLFFEVRP